MTELEYGEPVQVGDKVAIGSRVCEVSEVTDKVSVVQVNRKTTLNLPRVYSQEFKSPDESDENTYVVYRG